MAITVAVILGAAIAFYSYVLMHFWQETHGAQRTMQVPLRPNRPFVAASDGQPVHISSREARLIIISLPVAESPAPRAKMVGLSAANSTSAAKRMSEDSQHSQSQPTEFRASGTIRKTTPGVA